MDRFMFRAMKKAVTSLPAGASPLRWTILAGFRSIENLKLWEERDEIQSSRFL